MTRRMWLCEPLAPEVAAALTRLERTEDVAAMAVMPDVHLARDVCIGTVTATGRRLLPNAVGGDIGCGMTAVALGFEDAELTAPVAARVLAALYAFVPIVRHRRRDAPALPESLATTALSARPLERRRAREAALQLGTLGRGNHFVELQSDAAGEVWLMVHSGSRGLGPAIRAHHLERAETDPVSGIAWLDAAAPEGKAYLHDLRWARAYAVANRAAVVRRVAEQVSRLVSCQPRWDTWIDADHNHVQAEQHGGRTLWVHRKGAQSAAEGELGIIPGSMGTASFHVLGRGHGPALRSSSHGAGRAMSRSEARRRITVERLARDTVGVFYDYRHRARLREEAPGAYKDIHQVMRAQRELVRIVRRLRPRLVFKGT